MTMKGGNPSMKPRGTPFAIPKLTQEPRGSKTQPQVQDSAKLATKNQSARETPGDIRPPSGGTSYKNAIFSRREWQSELGPGSLVVIQQSRGRGDIQVDVNLLADAKTVDAFLFIVRASMADGALADTETVWLEDNRGRVTDARLLGALRTNKSLRLHRESDRGKPGGIGFESERTPASGPQHKRADNDVRRTNGRTPVHYDSNPQRLDPGLVSVASGIEMPAGGTANEDSSLQLGPYPSLGPTGWEETIGLGAQERPCIRLPHFSVPVPKPAPGNGSIRSVEAGGGKPPQEEPCNRPPHFLAPTAKGAPGNGLSRSGGAVGLPARPNGGPRGQIHRGTFMDDQARPVEMPAGRRELPAGPVDLPAVMPVVRSAAPPGFHAEKAPHSGGANSFPTGSDAGSSQPSETRKVNPPCFFKPNAAAAPFEPRGYGLVNPPGSVKPSGSVNPPGFINPKAVQAAAQYDTPEDSGLGFVNPPGSVSLPGLVNRPRFLKPSATPFELHEDSGLGFVNPKAVEAAASLEVHDYGGLRFVLPSRFLRTKAVGEPNPFLELGAVEAVHALQSHVMNPAPGVTSRLVLSRVTVKRTVLHEGPALERRPDSPDPESRPPIPMNVEIGRRLPLVDGFEEDANGQVSEVKTWFDDVKSPHPKVDVGSGVLLQSRSVDDSEKRGIGRLPEAQTRFERPGAWRVEPLQSRSVDGSEEDANVRVSEGEPCFERPETSASPFSRPATSQPGGFGVGEHSGGSHWGGFGRAKDQSTFYPNGFEGVRDSRGFHSNGFESGRDLRASRSRGFTGEEDWRSSHSNGFETAGDSRGSSLERPGSSSSFAQRAGFGTDGRRGDGLGRNASTQDARFEGRQLDVSARNPQDVRFDGQQEGLSARNPQDVRFDGQQEASARNPQDVRLSGQQSWRKAVGSGRTQKEVTHTSPHAFLLPHETLRRPFSPGPEKLAPPNSAGSSRGFSSPPKTDAFAPDEYALFPPKHQENGDASPYKVRNPHWTRPNLSPPPQLYPSTQPTASLLRQPSADPNSNLWLRAHSLEYLQQGPAVTGAFSQPGEAHGTDAPDEFGHRTDGRDEFGQQTDARDDFGQTSGARDEFGHQMDARDGFRPRTGGRDEFGQQTDARDEFEHRTEARYSFGHPGQAHRMDSRHNFGQSALSEESASRPQVPTDLFLPTPPQSHPLHYPSWQAQADSNLLTPAELPTPPLRALQKDPHLIGLRAKVQEHRMRTEGGGQLGADFDPQPTGWNGDSAEGSGPEYGFSRDTLQNGAALQEPGAYHGASGTNHLPLQTELSLESIGPLGLLLPREKPSPVAQQSQQPWTGQEDGQEYGQENGQGIGQEYGRDSGQDNVHEFGQQHGQEYGHEYAQRFHPHGESTMHASVGYGGSRSGGPSFPLESSPGRQAMPSETASQGAQHGLSRDRKAAYDRMRWQAAPPGPAKPSQDLLSDDDLLRLLETSQGGVDEPGENRGGHEELDRSGENYGDWRTEGDALLNGAHLGLAPAAILNGVGFGRSVVTPVGMAGGQGGVNTGPRTIAAVVAARVEGNDEEQFEADLKAAMNLSLEEYKTQETTDYLMAHATSWPSLRKSAPPKENVGRGLANKTGEYNCFLNVVIQSLWHLLPFRMSVITRIPQKRRVSPEHPASRHMAVLHGLVTIFRALSADQGKPTAVDPSALRSALHNAHAGSDLFQIEEMNDASEVLLSLFSCVHEALQAAHSNTPAATVHAGLLPTPAHGAPQLNKAGTLFKATDVCSSGCYVHDLFGLDMMEYTDCTNCGKRTHELHYQQFFHLVNCSTLSDVTIQCPGLPFAPLLFRVLHSATPLRPCDKDEQGCGHPTPTTHVLDRPPQLFTVALVWANAEAPQSQIRSVVNAINTRICVGDIFPNLLNQGSHTLRCVVCYYGLHYFAFAFSDKAQQWLLLDDTNVKAVGPWEKVVEQCTSGRLQPSVLFYQAQ